MRALKALVAVMSIMIVVGVGIIVVTIVHRMAHPVATAASAPSVAPAPAGTSPHLQLSLPAGGHLDSVIGVGDRLVLRVIGADGGNSLIVIDPATGAVARTIDLVPVPGPGAP